MVSQNNEEDCKECMVLSASALDSTVKSVGVVNQDGERDGKECLVLSVETLNRMVKKC